MEFPNGQELQRRINLYGRWSNNTVAACDSCGETTPHERIVAIEAAQLPGLTEEAYVCSDCFDGIEMGRA